MVQNFPKNAKFWPTLDLMHKPYEHGWFMVTRAVKAFNIQFGYHGNITNMKSAFKNRGKFYGDC